MTRFNDKLKQELETLKEKLQGAEENFLQERSVTHQLRQDLHYLEKEKQTATSQINHLQQLVSDLKVRQI